MSDNAIAPIQCRHGVFQHFRTDNAIGSHLRRFGEWAEEEILLMSLIVQEGWTALDVGANIGTHTVPLARMVGDTGRVLAFEPQSLIFPLLQMNILANGAFARVTPIKAIVTDTNALKFSRSKGVTPTKGNMGSHTFLKEEAGAEDVFDGEYILETSIDLMKLARCDFIKMDIQGFEKFALAGAEETISKLRPIIYYEQMGTGGHKEITEFLSRHGYVQLVHFARPYNLNNYNQFLGYGIGSNLEVNIVAFPSEKAGLVNRKELSARGIELFPGETLMESPKPARVSTPWSLPEDAYKGTRLEDFVLGPVSHGTVIHKESALKLVATDKWNRVEVALADIGAFHSFEGLLQADPGAQLNLQLLIVANSGDYVWTTVFAGPFPHGRSSGIQCRITANTFDHRTFRALAGPGHIELRYKSGEKGVQAEFRLSACKFQSNAGAGKRNPHAGATTS